MDKTAFENYVDNISQVILLNKKIDSLNARCTDIDQKIDAAELRNDSGSVEFLSCMYTALTEQQLELELERNKKEQEILRFALAAIKAE